MRILLLALALTACTAGGSTGDEDDDTGAQNVASTLTGLEWSMVGTWKGKWSDERWGYMVFNDDRTGCTWVRDGEDYARRLEEAHYVDWKLVADAIDSNQRMPLHYTFADTGEVYTYDEYDLNTDRIRPAGQVLLDMTWIDSRFDCDDTGTVATEIHVPRFTDTGAPTDTGPTNTGGPTGGEPTDTGTATPTGPVAP